MVQHYILFHMRLLGKNHAHNALQNDIKLVQEKRDALWSDIAHLMREAGDAIQ